MTGDGVNDILALKRADCSIAMNGGSQAAKNVSHVVLMNDDFATMPSIVSEGRRVINNIQRTGSLFLTKTFFATVLCVVFWIVSITSNGKHSYPFSTNNMLVWENLGIGLSSFFIALEPNSEQIRHGFLRNVFKRAIPAATIMLLAVATIYALYGIQDLGLGYTGVADFGFLNLPGLSRAPRYGATGMAVIVFSALSLVVLYMVCRPLNKYRAVVFAGCTVGSAVAFLVAGFSKGDNLFNVAFDRLTSENLIAIFAVIIIFTAIIIFGQDLLVAIKKTKSEDNKGEQDA
jgi:cation-transporting ATPase E